MHRDVAARNVLLNESLVAKIADFGLARNVNQEDQYSMQSNTKLPIKWLAPESLFDQTFTSKSDM